MGAGEPPRTPCISRSTSPPAELARGIRTHNSPTGPTLAPTEADQRAALEAWFSDPEADETEQLIDDAETAADEVEEFAAETGGHVYQDFEGIEQLDDTAEERSEVSEAVDEESEQPVQWREEEADEEAVEEQDDEVGPQRGRGGPKTATGTVTVLLDEPLETDDKYRLVSKDGRYATTLSAQDAKPLVDGARLLSFSGIDPKKQYELTHIRSTGAERVILPMNPFTALTKAGKRASSGKYTYVTLPSQVPEKLPDVHGTDRPVDPTLVATSPVLVNLAADDPRL